MNILGTPLGWIMSWIYNWINNYGWALIIFVVLVRAAQIPLAIKQQKSTARTAFIQPKLKQIQKQFAKNKERMQEETMKVYEEAGASMTAGCLPMFLTFFILFGIIDVIYNPLIHILHLDTTAIQEATTLLGTLGGGAPQLNIIAAIQGGAVSQEVLALVPQFEHIFGDAAFAEIQNFNMQFLGLNLGDIPQNVWGWTVLIPAISFVTQIGSTLVTMYFQSKQGMEMKGGMKWMLLLMPLLSIWIAFTLPVGVGMYWIISNILMLIQTVILHLIYTPEKVMAKSGKSIEKNREKMRKRREQMDALKEQQKAKIDGSVQKKSAEQKPKMSAEETARLREESKRRLAEARKRMAVKYGDEYKED